MIFILVKFDGLFINISKQMCYHAGITILTSNGQ